MGIKINEKEYSWGEVFIYTIIAYTIFKGISSIFGESHSDCIKYGMEEYGYSYDEAEEACQNAKSDAMDR